MPSPLYEPLKLVPWGGLLPAGIRIVVSVFGAKITITRRDWRR